MDLRALTSRQTLARPVLRQDRLATLTGSLNGTAQAGGGTLRGEIAAQVGVPHVSDLASRRDGDGRYAALTYLVEWAKPLAGPFSIALASAGQVASRPLLAVG